MTRQPKVLNITTNLVLKIPGKQRNVKDTEKRDKVIKILTLIVTYILLTVFAFIVLIPFYYMIAGSIMTEDEVRNGALYPTTNVITNLIDNYSQTINNAEFNYFQLIFNTLVVGVSTTCFGLVIIILTAFAFSRLNFKGKDILFTCFLATMMIPGEMMVITNYITMSNLGLIVINQTQIQAYLVMILPFLASVFYMYLLRQTFKQIPNELYLAAKVDGKSDWAYLWKVMVPLSSPTIITICILNLIGSWNAYVWPSVAVLTSDFYPISVALRSSALQKEVRPGEMQEQSSWQLAATVLTVVPLLILFIIFRKYILRGVGRAGIKG